MNRRIFAILSLLVVAIMCVGAASAFDLGSILGDDSSSEAQNITIDGSDFQIPAGFVEDVDEAMDNQKNETSGITTITNGKTFSKGSDVISIGVATYEGYEVDDSIASYVGDKEKTINGVDGYDYSYPPFDGFVYAKDGKLVIISLTDGNMLDEIILK